jgi:hypothetical protein
MIVKLKIEKERGKERFIPDWKEWLLLEDMENVVVKIPAKRVRSGYAKEKNAKSFFSERAKEMRLTGNFLLRV